MSFSFVSGALRALALAIGVLALADPGAAQISRPAPGGGDSGGGAVVETPPGGAGGGEITRPPPGGGGATPPGGGGSVTPRPPRRPQNSMAIFIAVSGQTTGPFDKAALEAKVASGELRPDTYVWKDGMAGWAPASTLPELQAMLNARGGSGPVTPGGDPVATLTGTWGFNNVMMPVEGVGQGTLNGQMVYTPTGQVSFQGTLDVFAQGQNQRVNLTGQGTFTARALAPNRVEVNSQVTMTMSNPMIGSQSTTSTDRTVYTIVDPNTIVDDEGNRGTRLQ